MSILIPKWKNSGLIITIKAIKVNISDATNPMSRDISVLCTGFPSSYTERDSNIGFGKAGA
jgi:hypothetical protein